ncbi:type VI secretion system protein TssA [Pelagibaculum spongiae]|uniref:Type VI secretion system protein TssA n=1 Tax=Pelagibaculum spongiae TaxID=2080658 RepID=A0A2V1GV13_9GAMM|nr:type VI secretion system protein TssA [Pelagibaculum spongiae]PVZ68783.1 type VI secretion system protein TssA [Pelagibaculum spongiae]
MSKQIEQALAPCNALQPCGYNATDDPRWEQIESQMMKVGSLAHQQVQWQQVKQLTIELLGQQTKDLRLVNWLMQVLQHNKSVNGFSDSLLLLSEFIAQYWLSCFPLPGKKGARVRQKLFVQIIQRTIQALDQLVFTAISPAEKKQLQLRSDRLLLTVTKHSSQSEFNRKLLDQLVESLGQKLKRINFESTAAPKVKSVSTSSLQQVTASAENKLSPSQLLPNESDLGLLQIDNQNERAIKQSLLKISQWYFETATQQITNDFEMQLSDNKQVVFDSDNSWLNLALVTRRQAIWFSIESLPQADEQYRTQLMAVSEDRVQQYRQQIIQGADFSLWQQVEQSLIVAPFWIDGHHLSSQIAISLGLVDQAETIRQLAADFIQRLPLLKQFTFKDGQPFVCDQTNRWLIPRNNQIAAGDINWQEQLAQVIDQAEKEGLRKVFQRLNEKLSLFNQSQPRQQFFWRLLIAEFLQSQQLSDLALPYLQGLQQQAEKHQLGDWEPELVQRLHQLKSL